MKLLFPPLLILFFTLTNLNFSFAEEPTIYINVGDAKVKKSLMALPALQFLGNPKIAKDFNSIGIELYKTLYNDLEVSNYFQFIRNEAFIEDPNKVGLLPAPGDPNGFNFKNWSVIGADFLVRAGYNIINNEVTLETYVYYVPSAKTVLAKRYKYSNKNVRKIAHTFANDLIQALTGKEGMFMSRIVLSSDRDGKNWKEIYLMDWDGQNIERMTRHQSIAISPSWSPDYNSIAYTAYILNKKTKKRNADLLIYDINTKKRWLVSQRLGINSGSVWFPDGKNLLLTISQKGSPDIFKMTREGVIVKRITQGPQNSMNVEPAISPDGKTIAFSSDRHGKPMIYTMNIDGSNVKRLIYVGKYNSTPSWSNDGKRIAFAGWAKGRQVFK